MKVLHAGIFKDHELGEFIFEKGLIQNGCEVERFDYRTLASATGRQKMLDRLLERAHGKDLLFIGKGELINKATLQKIRKLGLIIELWYGDYREPPESWLIENLHEVDHFFMTSGGNVLREYFEKGKPKTASCFFIPSDPELVTKYEFLPRCTRNVVFTGSNHKLGQFDFATGRERLETIEYLKKRKDTEFWGFFPSRNKYINFISRYWQRLTHSRFHSEWIRGQKYIAVIKSAKIGVGAMWVQNIPRYTSDRLQHHLAFGTFYLAWRIPEIEVLFDPRKELICFESIKELDEKIDYYLSNPTEREKIALAGQKKMLTEYNCKNIVGMMLDIAKTGDSSRFRWVEIHSRT